MVEHVAKLVSGEIVALSGPRLRSLARSLNPPLCNREADLHLGRKLGQPGLAFFAEVLHTSEWRLLAAWTQRC